MNAEQLRALQALLKDSYRNDAAAAVVTLSSSGEPDAEDVACRVETGKALVDAGLHPATGGTGAVACSGNMLLDALVAYAGVTLKAVAHRHRLSPSGDRVRAEGDLDFRGILGVSKDAPVVSSEILLVFELDTDEPADRIDQVTKLTQRFRVVFQTLNQPPLLTLEVAASGSD